MSGEFGPYRVDRFGGGYAVYKGRERVSGEHQSRLNAERAADRLARKAVGARRACLCCGEKFMSEGAHNRMCDRCRKTVSLDRRTLDASSLRDMGRTGRGHR